MSAYYKTIGESDISNGRKHRRLRLLTIEELDELPEADKIFYKSAKYVELTDTDEEAQLDLSEEELTLSNIDFEVNLDPIESRRSWLWCFMVQIQIIWVLFVLLAMSNFNCLEMPKFGRTVLAFLIIMTAYTCKWTRKH